MNVSEIWSLLKHPRRNWKIFLFQRNHGCNPPKHPRRNWKFVCSVGKRTASSFLKHPRRNWKNTTVTFNVTVKSNLKHPRRNWKFFHQRPCSLERGSWSILEGIESWRPRIGVLAIVRRSILEGIERRSRRSWTMWPNVWKHPRRNWKCWH